jgi:hypothetical protein
MMKYLIISLLLSFSLMAQVTGSKEELPLKDQMDEGDKQLLKRDTCRKPIEALETKYDNVDKKALVKMKENCQY